MTALSELLAAANTDGLSARELSRRARERGHTLNHDTVARYLRGAHGVPDEATLVALADVFGVPLRRLRHAAGLPSESVGPYVPPAEASRLSSRQRRAVDELIRAMVDPAARVDAGRPAADPALPRAARHGEPESPDAGEG